MIIGYSMILGFVRTNTKWVILQNPVSLSVPGFYMTSRKLGALLFGEGRYPEGRN